MLHKLTGRVKTLACLSCLLALTSITQGAPIDLLATVTPVGGGFHYDFTVVNNTAEDLAIVSIVDAPLGDPLIGPSLTGPVGFLTSYDGGLGFVDFLADTTSFAPGTTTSGFSFDSGSPPAPGVISSFEALSIGGTSFTGSIQFSPVVVPEPATLGLLAIGLTVLGSFRAKRARREKN